MIVSLEIGPVDESGIVCGKCSGSCDDKEIEELLRELGLEGRFILECGGRIADVKVE